MGRFIAISAAELAKFFRVTGKTIQQWRQDGMPGKPRRWDLAEIYGWKLERDKKREELLRSRRRSAALADPDHAYKTARARMMELKCETAERQLMPVADHDEFIVRLCATFRNGLYALAGTLSAHLEGLDESSRLEVIETHFRDLLAAFADGPAEAVEELDQGADDGGVASDPA